jgi:hypothetical protein
MPRSEERRGVPKDGKAADEKGAVRRANYGMARAFMSSHYSSPTMMRQNIAPSREDVETLAAWLRQDEPRG